MEAIARTRSQFTVFVKFIVLCFNAPLTPHPTYTPLLLFSRRGFDTGFSV